MECAETVVDEYGPTETTVGSVYAVKRQMTRQQGIGKPYYNYKIYVLDSSKIPIPIGVIGELYIGGAGLARGYLNNEALTSERFITNPFATDQDILKGYTRLYKTGDLVRWLPDGNLEYIGRNDEQVKVRGFRIELGEIEHALTQQEGVKQACVLAKEKKTETGSTKYLVGYYVRDDDYDSVTQATILSHLSRVLPEYMMPSVLIEMESFPLTINGKLDKRALPEADFSSNEEEYVEPKTEVEKLVAKIWQDVLGLDRVGVTDDFFRLGGNSILAIQVSHRMSKAMKCDVRVADVFRLRSVAALSQACKQDFSVVKPYSVIFNSNLPALIFLPPVLGGAEIYQGLADTLRTKFNCIGIDNYYHGGRQEIHSLHELAQYYLAQYESKWDLNEEVFLLGYSIGGKIALEIAWILEKRNFKRIKVILLDAWITDERFYFNPRLAEEMRQERLSQLRSEFLKSENPEDTEEKFKNIESESLLEVSLVSGRVNDAQILLFKATQNMRTLQYNSTAPYNNIELVAAKIDVINLKCTHYSLLNSKDIATYLLDMPIDSKR